MNRDTLRWVVASIAIHVVLVAALILYSGPTFLNAPREIRFIQLTDPTERTEPSVMDLPPIGRTGGPADRQPEPPADRRTDGPPDRRAARPVTPDLPDSAPEPPDGPPVPPTAVAAGDTGAADSAGAGVVAFGPAYESGRLWVRPLAALARSGGDAPAREAAIDNATHVARVDSAVAAKIRAFLDTLPPDSFAVARPPSWTTEIDGKTWGIDGSWIYLGDLRLPAAVLALLPFPQANYEQNQRAAELQRIREDILNAAWRAESAEQFKANVRALRERKDREREIKKNQQTKPDSVRT